nr:unnamed protein product [Digitaria exilis]
MTALDGPKTSSKRISEHDRNWATVGDGGGGRHLDGEGGRGGAAEVASELALLGDLLQQRVAGDLPRARPP